MSVGGSGAGGFSNPLRPKGQAMECKVVGVVTGDKLQSLMEHVRGMSYIQKQEKFQELVFKDPVGSNKLGSQIRLRKESQDQHRWIVRHEGAILRSTAAAELPATVQEVVEASCVGESIPAFWMALGLQLDYGFNLEGNVYHIYFQRKDLEIMLALVKRRPDPKHAKESKDPFKDCYLVEVTCKTDSDDHVEAAKATGAFAERLRPYVELHKPQ